MDFAHFLRELAEVHYSYCEKIVLVIPNLEECQLSLRLFNRILQYIERVGIPLLFSVVCPVH